MDFDKLVHQPTRLQIFAHLYRQGETPFQDLKAALDVTEGNLASHVSKMEAAGALTVNKEFVDKKPRTSYELTEEGEALFEEHVETLEALIDQLDGQE
jgi:DNA-binding MarR family transcriptional regulator